jgi:hypothetical protein
MERDLSAILISPEADLGAVETQLQLARDGRVDTFALVAEKDKRWLADDLQLCDEVETTGLAAMAQVRQRLRPDFQADEIKRQGDAALQRLHNLEVNRLGDLERALARLREQLPKSRALSDVERNTQLQTTLYVLQQIGPDILNDPIALRKRYLDALDAGDLAVVVAIEQDPIASRPRRALTPEELARGQQLQGLAASPELAATMRAYELLISRYRTRFATIRQRFTRAGWVEADPIAEAAR